MQIEMHNRSNTTEDIGDSSAEAEKRGQWRPVREIRLLAMLTTPKGDDFVRLGSLRFIIVVTCRSVWANEESCACNTG